MIKKLHLPKEMFDFKVSFDPNGIYPICDDFNMDNFKRFTYLSEHDGKILVNTTLDLADGLIFAAGGTMDHDKRIFMVQTVGIVADVLPEVKLQVKPNHISRREFEKEYLNIPNR